MSNLKKQLVNGTIWSFVGQIAYLLIGFISNIILARILTPYEFGQVGIVMFFIVISKVLTESGLSGALIRKSDVSDKDFSTVFVFNLIVSIILLLLLCSFSGVIAYYYGNNDLKPMLIALSSVLLINAFQFTQNAKIIKDMRFKSQSLYVFCSGFLSSVIGISLAFCGYGVWSLVIMQISNALFTTVIYWIFEGHMVKFVFCKESFKSLYKFGLNTTVASLITTMFDNIYNLILGRYFSIQQTGLYYQAKKLQEIPVGIIQSTTLGVVFSTLSKIQNEKEEFDNLYNKIIKVFTVIVGLICGLIYFYSEFCISVLYGQQWLGSVFYLKILTIAGFFFMQEMLNRVLFKVFDRTEKILKLEIIKKVIQSVTIVLGIVTLDIKILLYGFLFTSIVSYFVNYYVSRTIYSNFSWTEIKTVMLTAVCSSIVVFFFTFINSFLLYENLYVLIYFPFLVLSYLILVRLFGVLDILKEGSLLMKLINKK